MRILHTSDWHLGKYLEGYSRLDEQEQMIGEMVDIVNRESVDLVLIAGDIYDTMNPPSRAETLFYQGVKALADGGRRPVIVIAGNHDHPDRLQAAAHLAQDHGVLLMGMPDFMVPSGPFGQHHLQVHGQGAVTLDIQGQKVVFNLLPYPSEKRLNQVLSESLDEADLQRSYSEKVQERFSQMAVHFKEDTINIAMSHLFTMGGETTDSERPIQIGGGLVVNANAFPERSQYIALGHLHRAQQVRGNEKAYYAGSPLQYSRSEVGYAKVVKIVDLEAGADALVRDVYLTNYKPIETWTCHSVQEAIDRCEENHDRPTWVYLEIHTDKVLDQEDIRAIKRAKKDLLGIQPILQSDGDPALIQDHKIDEMTMAELFTGFFKKENGVAPTDQVANIFNMLVGEEGQDEADQTDAEWLEQLYRGTDH